MQIQRDVLANSGTSQPKQASIWENERLSMERSIELSIESLQAYGSLYKHWAIAYSGGKDSTAALTLVVHLIQQGLIPEPRTLTVLYADTRMELPPLQATALTILKQLEQMGISTKVVLPKLDERFYVYMFGRGVPPPKNRFRWCTSQLKVEPMEAELQALREVYGEKFLMLTGVRLGESAARDQRIVTSCSRDGAECGQGWFQTSTPESVADVLAPILHMRVCHVWDWLTFKAPKYGFETQMIAEVYGGDEKEELNARTGCIQCNLASKDTALTALLKLPQWQYLVPLTRLKPLYQEIIKPVYRIRKNGERNKDGKLSANPMRMGPLTMDARRYGLAQVLDIQEQVNAVACEQNRPQIDLINQEEEARIYALIEANTWPDKWTGDEVLASVPLPQVSADGVQPLLFGALEEAHT